MNSQGRTNGFLLHDVLIIVISFGITAILVKTEILANILTSTQEFQLLGSFVAGLFFTSVFTTAPAIVTLGEIAQANSIVLVALLGALGAVVGDLIIFRFVRDRFSEHVLELLRHRNTGKRITALFKLKLFRWLSFFVGGLIIASPLPDELGIGFFGFLKMKISWFIPLSFFFNFIGIVLIGLVARAIA
ncbi:hypothetical protein A3A36_00145 [Candidatus Kaiserbacteria bacterium RIFCSPLOWO2_01_FULL_52_12b]|uniref:TVP38/TMEM64 family membrane protein n=1 Tax=Candidatus Kaiserbacteria bacterium RIFCSPLOWO2_01_FULL_52_12b TaxID=1798509 RepID=A0A1F6EXB8_9BACT|nr:MAG: hypothetical protein A3A36_00145 [Candidatus Kaiserbacteria bacterium RIFCSPLOWO2_01_FULL_52_12b]